jgi:thymidylate kinase
MGEHVKAGHQRLPIIIEFLGTPGSGKSTLSHRVALRLRTMGILNKEPSYDLDQKNAILRQNIKLYKAIKHLIFKPVISLRTIREVVQSDQRRIGDVVNLVVNLLYISEYIRKSKRTNAVYIFDQGIYQALSSILYSAQKTIPWENHHVLQMIKKMIAHCKYVVILVYADTATVLSRMETRGGKASRLDQFKSREELSEQIETFFQSILEIEKMVHAWSDSKALSESEGISVIKIENGNGLSKVNETLLSNSIQTILNG